MKTKQIHATISNEGYKSLVITTYSKLLKVRPRLRYLLSPAEWIHVHMLLIYSRMLDCELHYHRITLPREFQIAIPEDIRVFEPIMAVISSIGIIEDVNLGVTYIPVPRSYRGNEPYKPHDKDDVTEFLEWTQYNWNSSWDDVEKGRLARRKLAAENNMKIPETDRRFDSTKLEEWQQLAVEKWLGWDYDLWFSYGQACYVLSRTAVFVPIPKDEVYTGNYAWLLPRRTNDRGGTFVRLPTPNLTPDSWMIALMLDMCALKSEAMSTWYYETNAVDDVQDSINRFVGAAIRDNPSSYTEDDG
eukprot:jgi/Psemu1/300750/fgenesh1_kg.18_\